MEKGCSHFYHDRGPRNSTRPSVTISCITVSHRGAGKLVAGPAWLAHSFLQALGPAKLANSTWFTPRYRAREIT